MNGTNKNDGRRWHIEEYLTGRKCLHIGRRVRINYHDKGMSLLSCRCFNSIDMFYWHIVVWHRVLEFHYYHRL